MQWECMGYAHGVAIICLSGNTGERVFLVVSVRAFPLPYSTSTNRFGDSPRLRPICFHACLSNSTHFTSKPKTGVSIEKREKGGNEGEEEIPLRK